jgi:hypothetical protein
MKVASKKEEHSDEMRKTSRTSMAALHPPVFIHSPPSSSIHRTMGWYGPEISTFLEKFKKWNINFNPAWC